MRVYTPLELAGRNIYMREGLRLPFADDPHAQGRGRPLRALLARGRIAVRSPDAIGLKAHWADLARVGGKYSNQWQVAHLINPRQVVPSSIMPRYGWLTETELEVDDLGDHLAAQRTVSVPTARADHERDRRRARAGLARCTPGLIEPCSEATRIAAFDGDGRTVTEMDALVAYLQVLGKLTDEASSSSSWRGADDGP
jgi:cytochrome c oxidase cbb3-type subunit 2